MSESSDTFFLKVIAANKYFYSDQAKNLIFETWNGQISFLPHHDHVVAAVFPGELSIQKSDGEWIHVVAGSGSMTFANNRAVVLVDTCETADEVDERRARESLERAKERSRQKLSTQEYRMNQASIARALSRLRFKGREYRN